ncbi:uncharacterized protein si:dkey-29h14.10 isoform X4 [Mobula hypostoma]|uniref:uncharacterized protein si:dkey-29h14.10 isoform X4 n=1 Tax=Mobula hypostoma TaxID=723540 RepID=UPI002FC34B28
MNLSGTPKAYKAGHLKPQMSSTEVLSSRTIEFDLRKHYYAMSMSMPPAVAEQIAFSLYSARILSQYELNVIISKTEVLSKASELLSVVIRKGSKACGIFLQVLKTCDPNLSEQLVREQVNSTNKIPMTELLKPPSYVQSPVICKICICNSSLNNCTFGSGNSMSIITTTPLSNTEEPATSINKECGNVIGATSTSCLSSISNDTDVYSMETFQADIEIVRSKLTNITVGESNVFTVVEEFSNKDDNEKDLEEELEGNDYNEQSAKVSVAKACV